MNNRIYDMEKRLGNEFKHEKYGVPIRLIGRLSRLSAALVGQLKSAEQNWKESSP